MTNQNPPFIIPHQSGSLIHLIIQPSAKKNAVVGVHDDRLKVCLKAPPVDGKANKAVIEFIAKLIGIPKSRLEITIGQTSRRKTVLALGVSPEEIASALAS